MHGKPAPWAVSKPKDVVRTYDAIAKSWDESHRHPFPALAIFISEFKKRFPAKGRVAFARILDAGCGNARNAVALHREFPAAVIYCADPSAALLLAARHRIMNGANPHNFILTRARLERLPYPGHFFDAVACTAVLHHLESDESRVRALSEIRRVLAHQGFAFVTVWNHPSGAKPSDLAIPWPTEKGRIDRYYHFFSESELTGLARRAGLKVRALFLEAGGKKTGRGSKARNQNICMVLEK